MGIGVSNVVYMDIEASNVLNMSIMHTYSRTDRRLSYLLSRKDVLYNKTSPDTSLDWHHLPLIMSIVHTA